MNRSPTLTDTLLREALAPDPDAVLPPGLLDSIGSAIRSTPQERVPRPVAAFERWAAAAGGLALAWTPRSRTIVLVLTTVAIVLALLGAALLGAGRGEPDWIPLRPTGLVQIAASGWPVDHVFPGADGRAWAVSAGEVVQFHPDTGDRRRWSAAEDRAFAVSAVGPAADGGIWMVGDGMAQHFDGTGFTRSIPVRADNPMEVVELPDGTLWLTSWDLGLQRWDGHAWVAAPPGRPTASVGFPLLVLGPEDVWVENPGPGQRGGDGPRSLGVSHLVGDRWVTYDTGDAPQLAGSIGAIERAADGSIWVTQDHYTGGNRGIARFDGSSWTTIEGPPTPAWLLEADPDGSMWAITRAADGSSTVARWADGTWREFNPADGVESRALGGISVTPAGAYLGTGAGLLRFADGRWVAAWPDQAASRGPQWTSIYAAKVAAVSESEAWATEGADLWHWVDGAWERPLQAVERDGAAVHDIALAPDGSVWMVTDRAVQRWRDGRLETAAEPGASRVAVGPDGVAWAGGNPGEIHVNVRRIAPNGDGFDVSTLYCPLTPFRIAVASDGTAYFGDVGYSTVTPGLARSDGVTCEIVALPPAGGNPAISGIEADPLGGVVIEAVATLPGDPGGGRSHWYLLHVDGMRVTLIADEGELEGSMSLRHVDEAGRVWRAAWDAGAGLEVWDGSSWTRLLGGIPIFGAVDVAPDGTVYIVDGGGLFQWIPDAGATPQP